MSLLSLFVILGVFWCLKLTGITMAGEAFCGMEEHTHGENCPTGSLICELEETEGHTHGESCIVQHLICEREEISPHTHDESCKDRELVCTEEEREGHTHGDDCRGHELICTEAEREGHSHGEDCFTPSLICTAEEAPGHSHGEDCFTPMLICADEDPEHLHGEACYENTLTCEQEETEGHTHGEACYENTLTCTVEEDEGHIHGDGCYSPEESILCGLEEEEGHTHGDECYVLHEDSFLCGLEETEGHTHGDECYQSGIGFGCGMTEAEGHVHTEECRTEETELGCGKEYAPAHTHTDECYENKNQCPLEEHTHVESCYSDIDADVETEADWKSSVSGVAEQLTTSEMLAEVARSQLGNGESTLNFEVDHLGVRRGITRYGQWYGNPYGDWSAMFAMFCLHYAGAEDLPANAGPESLRLEWEAAGLYEAADGHIPEVGDLVFLRYISDLEITDVPDAEIPAVPDTEVPVEINAEVSAEPDAETMTEPVMEPEQEETVQTEGELTVQPETEETEGELPEALSAYLNRRDGAVAVAIVTEVTGEGITVIQGDVDNAVAERTLAFDDPSIIGYGTVPDSSPYAVGAERTGSFDYLAHAVNYSGSLLTEDGHFVLYTLRDGVYYAIDGNANAVPIEIDGEGGIYTDAADPDSLLWTFTPSGDRYVIANVGTGLYLHPFYNGPNDNGIINTTGWDTPLTPTGTGVKLIHSASARLNDDASAFEITRDSNQASVFQFGMIEYCTVWLDGSNGGVDSSGGSQNRSYQVGVASRMTLPSEWLSPTKYHYRLRGWYDVTHDQYYPPGASVTVTENTVFYADWMAATYDIGQYNAHVANTVSTDSFVTTRMFDYNYLFNVLSADSTGTVSSTGHSETWNIVRDENVDFENRETLNFIFLDYGDSGTLEYPNNRDNGVNAYPGDGIVTGGIYNDAIGEALFSEEDDQPGRIYLGTGDHLFQIMDDPSDPYYGYYYYDSARNAAAYNQSDGRFYVYDYLEATSAELSASKSDFLPLNSPYANTNGRELGTYVPDSEHSRLTNYVYDAKYDDSGNSVDRVGTNYAFGMKIDIRFYLPNAPGEGGNQDVYGNDMRFMFSGDDDLWVLVDGELALDIGGIHQAETGEINFSTGEVLVQGSRHNALSDVVSSLEAGEHTLTVMYLERGGSHSNCAIYFNLAPRFQLSIQKEDVLTRDVLNGAQFSVFRDLECTIPAELWENEASYLRGDPATNTFTVTNGVAYMWGMGAGNTYYIRETKPPDNADYGFPNGIIRMVLDKRGAATYSVMILDEGNGISGGFTVHGFRVDEETQQAYIIATNAPKWVQDVTSVQARKFWADNLDHSGQTVTVYLTIHDPDGTVRRLQEAQLSDETDWQHLWENLPKYYEDGTEVQYGVEEAYVSGYYSAVEEVDTYSVTTTQWNAVNSLENGRTYLLRTGSGYLSTQNRNSDTGFMWVDEATAKQSDLAQWTVTAGSGGYKLTNRAGQSLTFYYNNGNPTDFFASGGGESNASKQYFKYSVSGSQIRIYYDAPNNRDYYLISSMTGSQKFQYNTSASRALLFTPMTQVQSTTTKSVDGQHAFQITNTPLDTETSLTVSKQWRMDGGDDPTLYEKEQVTVKLLANGKDTGRTVTLSLKNGWTDVFRGLPYEDGGGNVIVYTVEEVWSSKDWMVEYGPIYTSGGTVPVYDTTVTNVYRWGHGVELPSTGTSARLLFILCGSGMMLFSLVIFGFVSRRKRERRSG